MPNDRHLKRIKAQLAMIRSRLQAIEAETRAIRIHLDNALRYLLEVTDA